MVYHFHGLMLLEHQIAEDAEQYHRCQQEAGNPVNEPEESPETDDGYSRPYRRYASCVEVAEHDERNNSQ